MKVSRRCEKYGYKEREAYVLLDIVMYPDTGKILFICTKTILYIFFLKLQLYDSPFSDSVLFHSTDGSNSSASAP